MKEEEWPRIDPDFEEITEGEEGCRCICVDLYDAIVRLRPEWHDPDDDRGVIKVVMTGSAGDPAEFRPHLRNKARQEAIKQRLSLSRKLPLPDA